MTADRGSNDWRGTRGSGLPGTPPGETPRPGAAAEARDMQAILLAAQVIRLFRGVNMYN